MVVTLTDSATDDDVYVFGNRTDASGDYGLRQVEGTYDVLFTPPDGSGLPTGLATDVELTEDTVLDFVLGDGPPPIEAITCSARGADVTLAWTNGATDYDSIEVSRDGVFLASLAGDETSFVEAGLDAVKVIAGFTCVDPCREDLDGSGEVGFDDLLQLLAAWGPCPDCPEDLNDDDEVGFDDLLRLLAAWGACE